MSANNTRYQLTAIIKDKKGRILSIGKNSYIKTHPMMYQLGKKVGYHKGEKINIHAEIDAINKCKNINKAYVMEIYNYSDRWNKYIPSKPCSICTLGIEKTPIRFIVYMNKELQMTTEQLY